MLLEICATSVLSAKNAQDSGAHRIELCSELAVGGITPSFGLIRQVLDAVFIPVFVLIRPRSGNFNYSEDEFQTMLQDIRCCKKMGCAGIVSGVLTADNQIDFARTRLLVEASGNLPFTFHRAFDCVRNPMEALEQLEETGIHRILTSGQEETTEKGLKLLIQLKNRAKNTIILPGGGINGENAILFKQNSFTEIHASASSVFSENEAPKVAMNSEKFFDETKVFYSDTEKIKAILKAVE